MTSGYICFYIVIILVNFIILVTLARKKGQPIATWRLETSLAVAMLSLTSILLWVVVGLIFIVGVIEEFMGISVRDSKFFKACTKVWRALFKGVGKGKRNGC